jgi:P-type Cu+ transporter
VVEQRGFCALCGLRFSTPVVRAVAAEEKRFCCEGCARVYELAYENGLLDQILGRTAVRVRPLAAAAGPGETAYFAISGMWCAGCAVAAEGLLRRQPGVRSADVSFAAERGRLSYDPIQTDARRLLARLEALGYRARLLSDPKEAAIERRQEGLLLQLIVAAAFGMQVMMIYLASLYPRYAVGDYTSSEVRTLQYLAMGLTVPVLLVGGSSFVRGAWRALLAHTATMDTLVALGTMSAFLYSLFVTVTGSGAAYFDSVCMITTLVMIGRYLESVGGNRARRDIRSLLTLQPQVAWGRQDGTWTRVESTSLLPGDEILVKQGERVPVDARVSEGSAALDESLLTGESSPVEKRASDLVSAGTLVVDGSLIATAVEPVSDSRLAQISRLIEETLAAKPPLQRLADRASAYFTFGILGVAVLTLMVWVLLGRSASESLVAAVAVLVVACPCALGLATPLALTVALGLSARAGMVVRNPAALEMASTVKRVAFDKTGTVTHGRMSVQEVVPLVGSEADLLCDAAAVEQFSEHPVATAIVASCPGDLPKTAGFEVHRGRGSTARLISGEERRVMVGSPAYLNLDPDSRLLEEVKPHVERGSTVVWVGREDRVSGYIVLRDEPNASSRPAFEELERASVKTSVLSGDHPATVRAVAAEVGAVDWAGGLSAGDKAERIQAWQRGGEVVALVGDGVNDAPALAQADLAIALAGGTDLAGETADVILTRTDLKLVPWFLRLSAHTRRNIRENLGWAFAYNLVAVPLAAVGLISPVIAAATMSASSLLVVGNSLRLNRLDAREPHAGIAEARMVRTSLQ